MTAQDYEPFVERMISRYEGGYGWDRNDPGGPTKYGVTCYDLAEFMHQKMDSMARWAPIVQAMTMATAEVICKQKYAEPCAFDELGPGKDCVVFDFGYNSGTARSIKFSQRIVGVHDDGVMGPVTLAAINTFPAAHFINELCDARMQFLRSLKIWPTFRRGWSARVADLRRYSLALLEPPKLAGALLPSRKLTRIPGAYAKAYGP